MASKLDDGVDLDTDWRWPPCAWRNSSSSGVREDRRLHTDRSHLPIPAASLPHDRAVGGAVEGEPQRQNAKIFKPANVTEIQPAELRPLAGVAPI